MIRIPVTRNKRKERPIMNNFSIGTPVNAAPTGIATFAKCPICTDIRTIEADIGILGAPFDIAI